MVTDSNAFDLMNAAKVLSIGDLEYKCSEFIQDKVNETNVGFFTGKAIYYDAKESLNVCLNFFKENTLEVLNASEFLDITHEALLTFSKTLVTIVRNLDFS